MKKFILSITLTLFFTIIMSGVSFAYTTNSAAPTLPLLPSVNPVDYLKSILPKTGPSFTGIGTSVPSIPSLQNLKNLLPSSLGGSGISKPTSNTTGFSTGDIGGSLKAIGVLAINLFLIVIQTVAGILKALLPFLSK